MRRCHGKYLPQPPEYEAQVVVDDALDDVDLIAEAAIGEFLAPVAAGLHVAADGFVTQSGRNEKEVLGWLTEPWIEHFSQVG